MDTPPVDGAHANPIQPTASNRPQPTPTDRQGLLDLEGSSLTPILVSLVQKDASMLDAFGKVTH